MRSRLLAAVLLGIAIVALAIAFLARPTDRTPPPPRPEEKVRVTIQASAPRPISLPPSEERADAAKAVRLELPDEPAIGRTVYATAYAKGKGDGSRERPLRDIQAALCELEPGDRLILWDGSFRGPFVVGEECSDGTREAPIEVYAAADSVLHGGEHSDEPVLTLARAHWRLHDLMVVPLESLGGGIVILPPASDVVLDSAHVRSGRGNGIEIRPGVSDIVIRGAHLHHLGIQEGGHGKRHRGERVDPATTPPGAGIRIYPGTRNIRVLASEIRNVWGFPVEVVSPADHDPRLPPAIGLEIDDAGFVKVQQEQWW